MEIKGFIDLSFSDWDQKVSSVIFLPNCNMRCPFCYNVDLVLHPEKLPTIRPERIEGYLKRNREWIDGVVITGGEPTLHRDLSNLCKKLKQLGYSVKLDTNGTNPELLRELIEQELIDYVALDVKAPLDTKKYREACGVDTNKILEKIEKTIHLLLADEIQYEFRTTLVPTVHTSQDVEEICKKIKGCKKYALQNFKAEVETINPNFKNLRAFSQAEMENFYKTAKRHIPNTILRT